MVVGGTALFGGGRGGATPSKALVEFRAGKMTTAAGEFKLIIPTIKYLYRLLQIYCLDLFHRMTFNLSY